MVKHSFIHPPSGTMNTRCHEDPLLPVAVTCPGAEFIGSWNNDLNVNTPFI